MQSLRVDTQATDARALQSITEVVLPNTKSDNDDIILPMLAHLSRQSEDKWFTWINPDRVAKQTLELYGFDLKKIRVIHTQNEDETLWVLWEALNNGKSSSVVANITKLSETSREKLEAAACHGNTRGLILSNR